MLSFSEFIDDPYFTALEILIVCLCSQLILAILSRTPQFQSGIEGKKTNTVFLKTKYWIKHISRYPKQAVDVRRSWALKRSEEEFKAEPPMPSNPLLSLLPMIANMGPSILVNFAISDRIALHLPFAIPRPLRGLLQYGLQQTQAVKDTDVSAFGLYFFMNLCSSLFIGMIPFVGKKREWHGPKDNYRSIVHEFVSEHHEWELDDAEAELLKKIDSA
jgi:hypothetical protein